MPWQPCLRLSGNPVGTGIFFVSPDVPHRDEDFDSSYETYAGDPLPAVEGISLLYKTYDRDPLPAVEGGQPLMKPMPETPYQLWRGQPIAACPPLRTTMLYHGLLSGLAS